ncbi:NIPSNAP family protein [Microbacteriaceae bacterium K1510]|nr:NIPSNAP family protein [Microbacteriaceae bacterium K1510]
MIVEQRTYTLPHGTMTTYLERYEKHALPVQKRHLGPLLGFYVTEIGTLNQVVHLWAYDSLADREERREKLAADPEWHAFLRINAGSFTHQEVKIMKPTRFSPDPLA